MKLDDKRKELISRIPQLSKLTESKYDKVMAQLNTLVWNEIDVPLCDGPAACTRTVTGTYSVYVTKTYNKLAYDELLMHEAGHIIKQHLKDVSYKNKMVEKQIRMKWKKFKEHINMEGNSEDVIAQDFINLISNLVQDFEINSDYWPTEKEWTDVNERISDTILVSAINNGDKQQLESIENWMNEKPDEIHKYSKGCHPIDYGFPSGLTWTAYLHLILTKPNEFMKNMEKNLDSQENRDGQGSENGNSSNKDGRISASKISKAANKGDVDNKKAKEVAQKIEDDKNKGKSKSESEEVGNSQGYGHLKEEQNTVYDYNNKDVIKFIERNCIGKTLTRDRQDYLYNYNRGKSSGVLRTRTTTIEEHRPGNLVALVDVSGSVDIDRTKFIISEIVKYKSKFGRDSRVIFWDTELVADVKLNKQSKDNVLCGGGTNIAAGIKYAKKYLKSEYDKLCIISDFQDNMDAWGNALKNAKFDVFSICWDNEYGFQSLKDANINNKTISRMKNINVA